MGDIADWMFDQALAQELEDEFSWGDEPDFMFPTGNSKRRRKSMKVKGTAMWASVQAPNTTYDPVYCIDLIVVPEVADSLKQLGLKGKSAENGIIFKFKRNQFRADGTENNKPAVRDADNQPFTDLIGNGSEVIVQFSTYEWTNKFGKGISADLQGVQVVNLVPYRTGDGDEFTPLGEDSEEEVLGANSTPPKPSSAEAFDDDVPDVL